MRLLVLSIMLPFFLNAQGFDVDDPDQICEQRVKINRLHKQDHKVWVDKHQREQQLSLTNKLISLKILLSESYRLAKSLGKNPDAKNYANLLKAVEDCSRNNFDLSEISVVLSELHIFNLRLPQSHLLDYSEALRTAEKQTKEALLALLKKQEKRFLE